MQSGNLKPKLYKIMQPKYQLPRELMRYNYTNQTLKDKIWKM